MVELLLSRTFASGSVLLSLRSKAPVTVHIK